MGEVEVKEEYSRIVRVSRSGYNKGKDRHSKVKTFKGVRDRRVRLSTSTALQLYALQEKLQLSQPSKVVEWLLKAAKHDIHLLPPLSNPHQPHPLPPHFDTFNPLLHSSFSPSDSITLLTTSRDPLFAKECIVEDEHTGGVKHLGITEGVGFPLRSERRGVDAYNGCNELISPALQHDSMFANTSTSPFLNTRL